MFPTFCLAFALLQPPAAQAAGNADLTARWREDIDFMVEGLAARGMTIDLARGPSTRGQKDFEKLYPSGSFGPAIAALKEQLPRLSGADVVLELMRIHAGAKVAHNSIGIPDSMGFENRLPVQFRWYADGLAIVSATATHREVIGARVRTIGTLRPDQILARLTPFIAQENQVWVRAESTRLMVLEPILSRIGLTGGDGLVRLTFEDPLSSEVKEARLPFSSAREGQESFRKVRGVPPVVYASSPGRYYWHRYLEDSRTMFVQYNVCRQDPKLPMTEFASQVARELYVRQVDRVVLDLRFNGGGDSRVINPLADALRSRQGLKGKVYVLIGPGTFSSAVDNAILFKLRGATLVGEPSGGMPSGYGEVKTLTLPNSKLQVRYTSKFFSVPKRLDKDSLMPDIQAPMTFRDALAGRDAALDAAIAAKLVR